MYVYVHMIQSRETAVSGELRQKKRHGFFRVLVRFVVSFVKKYVGHTWMAFQA